jgi:flavodoxin I
MKALVVYDSVFGNTGRIAESIGGAISGDTKVSKVEALLPADLEGLDLLVLGSPTRAGRPTQPMQDFLARHQGKAFARLKVASFDTRVPAKWVAVFGFAAKRMAKALEVRGGSLVAPPEAFFVAGERGPLKEGEEERAAAWARGIARAQG